MTKMFFDKKVWLIRVGIVLFTFLLFYFFYTDIINDDNIFNIGNVILILTFSSIILCFTYRSFIQRYYFYSDKVIVRKLFSKKTYLIDSLSNIQIIDQKNSTKYSAGKATYYPYKERSEDLHSKNKFTYTILILFQFDDTNKPNNNTYISTTNTVTKNYFVIEYRRSLDFYLCLYEEKLKN